MERQRQKTTTVTLLRDDEEKKQPCLILTRHKLLLLISIAWVHEHIISNIVINKAALMQFRICIVMRNIFTFKWNLSHRIHCLRWRRRRWLLLYPKLIDFINRHFVSAPTNVPFSFYIHFRLQLICCNLRWLINIFEHWYALPNFPSQFLKCSICVKERMNENRCIKLIMFYDVHGTIGSWSIAIN